MRLPSVELSTKRKHDSIKIFWDSNSRNNNRNNGISTVEMKSILQSYLFDNTFGACGSGAHVFMFPCFHANGNEKNKHYIQDSIRNRIWQTLRRQRTSEHRNIDATEGFFKLLRTDFLSLLLYFLLY